MDGRDNGRHASTDWRCRLCGHWLSVPVGSHPLAVLQQTAGKPRECVVRLDGRSVHRCDL